MLCRVSMIRVRFKNVFFGLEVARDSRMLKSFYDISALQVCTMYD